MEKLWYLILGNRWEPRGSFISLFFFFAFKVREKGVRVIQSGKSMDSEDEEKQKV